ncbi:MAG: enoyl-CoA hydratase/isomerase family protein [Actinomycetota bacterium]|nr:enoyl-CoA hydratase/isomerase family protein [Actinomycetota bacterium]
MTSHRLITRQVSDGVQIVTMDAGENRLGPAFVAELRTALADAAAAGGPLVLTGTGKVFCNGLDLDAMVADPDSAAATMAAIHDVLAAVLSYPGATVAALNGHTFGAGAILAAACDQRVMRADRGFFCFPEVDLGLSMSVEFDAVLRSAYDTATLRQALLSGERYPGPAAADIGLVDAVAAEDELTDRAVAIAAAFVGKDGATITALRRPLCAEALAALAATPAPSPA